MNFEKIYEYALQREKEGYLFFKTNAEKATHAAAAEVLQKLEDEELMRTPEQEAWENTMELKEDGWVCQVCRDVAGGGVTSQPLTPPFYYPQI